MRFLYCENDGSFGPAVQRCSRQFDFTVKFQTVVLNIIPSVIFLSLVIPRLLHLIRKSPVVGGGWFQALKLGSSKALFLTLVFLRVALVIIGATAIQFRSLIIASEVISFIDSLSMGILSSFEHARDGRPSVLLNMYLPLMLLFGVARVRTLFFSSLDHGSMVFTAISTAALSVKAVLAILESIPKSRWFLLPSKKQSPEETSGIYSLATSAWLAKLLLTGYKVILQPEHLYPLEASMRAEHLEQIAVRILASGFHGSQHTLLRSVLWELRTPFLLPIITRAAQLGFDLSQPLFIQSLLNYLSQPTGTERSASSGYGLIGAAIFIYAGAPMASALQAYFHQRFLFKLRSVLVCAIFIKTSTANATAGDEKKSLTLMSTDVQRIVLGFTPIHDLWAIPIQLGVTYYLLFRQIGPSFTASVVVTLICIVTSSSVMRIVARLQKRWMEHVQARIGKTASTIANIKSIKISALVNPTQAAIQSMRIKEISVGNRFRGVLLVNIALGFAPGLLAPMFTFVTAMRHLSVTAIFTSMSLMALAGGKLNILIQKAPYFMASLACFQRIQEFLEGQNWRDFREPLDSDVDLSGKSGSQTTTHTNSIKIRDGSFGWEEGKYTVKNISTDIDPGLTIVAGPVASGKSTLCKALLGETPSHQGHINLGIDHSKVAFCDQTPFLVNATIRENIAGKGTVDDERYQAAIEATMLHVDLLLLPLGDATMVGSNGGALSGGQKQRVAIARALYECCQLNVFDDVLSGLDQETEQQVFSRCFGSNGLLRQRNATIILCTHSARHFASASHIIIMSSEGKISEQGTFASLQRNGTYIQTLGMASQDNNNTSDGDGTDTSSKPKVSQPKQQPGAATASTKDKTRTIGDRKVFMHYFRSIGILRLSLLTFLGVLCGFLWNFPNVWLKFWSEDSALTVPSHGTLYWLGIYSTFAILSLITITAEVSIGMLAVAKVTGAKLHGDALHTVMTAPLRLFATTDTGVITNLFSQDMSLVDEELPVALLEVVIMTWIVVGAAAVTAAVSPYVLIAYPFIFASVYFIQRFYLRTSRQLRLLDLEAKSPLYTHFLDTIKGISTIRAFGWSKRSASLNLSLLDASIKPDFQLRMIQSWLSFILGMLVAILAIAVIILATQLKADAGFTGASMVSIINFGGYLSSIIVNYTLLETSIGAVNRLKTFSEASSIEDAAMGDGIPPSSWPSSGHIVMKGVSASYDDPKEGTADGISSKMTLKNVNLEIMPGEKVAIFADQSISIDGECLADIDGNVARQRIIAIPQEAAFLPDGTTFRINIDPEGSASDDVCKESLEAVGMWTYVTDHGGLTGALVTEELSHGQKQLFALGRAVVRCRVRAFTTQAETGESSSEGIDLAPHIGGGVLMLDEYNSNVDVETDKKMQGIIAREFKHYTVLMVSHRLESTMAFDKIVVLDAGQVVEQGAPRALLEQENSRFRGLWASAGN
ncbi:hypothetical protein NLG97_g96 [Lecanicillium saksenae]|uniref:Uncharacterized protein n=1 Tax=Lecanicillium saksenae TaxID=468837 RepID=A0ACC1R846_9HYPO|nr:hypothetical protein NLG97_g96 [Lecanicillium saksenae]